MQKAEMIIYDVSINELYSMINTESNKQNVHFTFGSVVK